MNCPLFLSRKLMVLLLIFSSLTDFFSLGISLKRLCLPFFLNQTPVDKSTWQSPRHLLATTKVVFSLLSWSTSNAESHETFNTYSIVPGKSCFLHFHPDCAHNLKNLFGPGHLPLDFNPYSCLLQTFFALLFLAGINDLYLNSSSQPGSPVLFSFGDFAWQLLFSNTLRCSLWIALMDSLYQPNSNWSTITPSPFQTRPSQYPES